MRSALLRCLCSLRLLALRSPYAAILVMLIALTLQLAGSTLQAQSADRVLGNIASSKPAVLPNHHPAWANEANSLGALPGNQQVQALTVVLARSPEQETAFTQLLADQQTPGSSNYHHWLTAAEIGKRFGPSDHDFAAVQGWLKSQGLSVTWTAPSRMFIGFSGTAADVNSAFQTELHTYSVAGKERMSVSTDPTIPSALVPVIKSIRGLYTIEERSYATAHLATSPTPQLTSNSGNYYLAPADFSIIYNVPTYMGSGQTIGIVGRSRVNPDDIKQFIAKTGLPIATPTEIIPTAFGGVDPGPPYTAPPSGNVSLGDQLEATLDVTRSGSVANEAQIDLVVATSSSGGVGAAAQYLVNTTPLPAQVISISFGACESAAGPSAVSFWDSLFQVAAGEGISVFVASGDSGASGCDHYFATPPASPKANSPNYICSSSYATCVGGTEFNDTKNPSDYWGSTGSGLGSALGYIPEGGWNEPLNSKSAPQAAASGGGVSSVIATPSWQTGTGVPSARAGRYTPDLSFSASGHDGYFACFAASGYGCVSNSDGSFSFVYFSGTSAAAPDMAGITTMLNQNVGAPQGNLNPQLYAMASTSPSAFHDVTVSTSGVASCDVNTASMCNNSIPGPSGLTGGQPGYLVGPGYDEVTGLGSLDVGTWLSTYPAPPTIRVLPASLPVDFGNQIIGYPSQNSVTLQNSGSETMNPISIKFSGANPGDYSESDNCNMSLNASGTCTVRFTFTPAAAGTRTATASLISTNAANSPQTLTLTGVATAMLPVPTVFTSLSSESITTAESVDVQVSIMSSQPTSIGATGTVTVSGAGFNSGPIALNGVSVARFTIPAGTFPIGTVTLTSSYSGDGVYPPATGTASLIITAVPTPSFTITGTAVTVKAGATTGNTSTITVSPANGFTGTVALTAKITSSPTGAAYLPTVSFGSSGSVAIAGTANGTATLTVTTSASSGCTQSAMQPSPNTGHTFWLATGGITLAGLCMLGIPARKRRLRGFALLLLSLGLASAVTACGGGSGGGKSTCLVIAPGTTTGTYTITITGTSGTLTSSNSITLTVQ